MYTRHLFSLGNHFLVRFLRFFILKKGRWKGGVRGEEGGEREKREREQS